MKKIVFIAIAAIAFATGTQAQDSSSAKEKMHKEHGTKMNASMSELNLTADQQEKMKKLREDSRVKMEAVQNNTSLSEDQKMEQLKKLRLEQRTGMESILTDEQKTKWKEMRKDQMMHRRDMKAGSDSTMQHK